MRLSSAKSKTMSVSPYAFHKGFILTSLKLTCKTLLASMRSCMHETSSLGLLNLDWDLFVPQRKPAMRSNQPMDLGMVHMHFWTLAYVTHGIATTQMRVTPVIRWPRHYPPSLQSPRVQLLAQLSTRRPRSLSRTCWAMINTKWTMRHAVGHHSKPSRKMGEGGEEERGLDEAMRRN